MNAWERPFHSGIALKLFAVLLTLLYWIPFLTDSLPRESKYGRYGGEAYFFYVLTIFFVIFFPPILFLYLLGVQQKTKFNNPPNGKDELEDMYK